MVCLCFVMVQRMAALHKVMVVVVDFDGRTSSKGEDKKKRESEILGEDFLFHVSSFGNSYCFFCRYICSH
jgi:hypothetical protein